VPSIVVAPRPAAATPEASGVPGIVVAPRPAAPTPEASAAEALR
jgi:hypothetical protein